MVSNVTELTDVPTGPTVVGVGSRPQGNRRRIPVDGSGNGKYSYRRQSPSGILNVSKVVTSIWSFNTDARLSYSREYRGTYHLPSVTSSFTAKGVAWSTVTRHMTYLP